jgi:hypothetical protein
VRRLLTAFAVLGVLALPVATAQGKRDHHKASGIAGVVVDYDGAVTINVTRASDGQKIASKATSDGHFKLRLKRGSYNVSSVPPTPPTCNPTPQTACPLDQAQSAAIVRPCLQGETKHVQVRRHRFTHVELHVTNVCVV